MSHWANSVLEQVTTSAERCQARTAESRLLIADTRAFLSASREVRVRTRARSIRQRRLQIATYSVVRTTAPDSCGDAGRTTVPAVAVVDEDPHTHRRLRRELVGRNVRLARTRSAMSQQQLALMVDAKREHVSDWERGRHEPGAASIARLSEALGVPAGWFFLEHEA